MQGISRQFLQHISSLAASETNSWKLHQQTIDLFHKTVSAATYFLLLQKVLLPLRAVGEGVPDRALALKLLQSLSTQLHPLASVILNL